MKITLNKPAIEGVADTGCAMSLIDMKYLSTTLLKAEILKMPAPINVRGIGNALHQSNSMLSDLEKEAIRTLAEGADHWCNALLKNLKNQWHQL
jgi:hypothetical protein